MKNRLDAVTIAWLITAVYYFLQYSLRSAPSVMMPELGTAFGLGSMGVASLVGLFYYGYSPFSLVAGVGMDRLGPRKVVPLGALLGPVFAWLLVSVSQGADQVRLEHYQTTFAPLLYGVVLAIVLTLLLRETGTAVRRAIPEPRERDHDTGNRTGKDRDGQVRGAAGAVSKP